MITGYNDGFNRTVSGGLGTATSGQAYTIVGTASQYNVAPTTATILPTAVGERYGYVDRQTTDIDISGQVALSGIPATNLATVGFVAKLASASNYYNATMMVATGGAVSLRFSKVVGGGLSTIATVATGLTYVANTFYNLRVAVFWSNLLQAHVLQSKLWAIGATEPGGWMATATDAGLTQYTTGTNAGIFARDESTVSGTITAKIQNVAARTYGLPVPATTDTMCADLSFAYPKQTELQSLAQSADAVMAGFDSSADLAGLFPRVRVSNSNFAVTSMVTPSFTATEFDVGTGTNLGFDPTSLYLPVGIWVVTLEVELAPASPADYWLISTSGGNPLTSYFTHMRANAAQSNTDGQGGSGHVSGTYVSTDPATNITVNASIGPIVNASYTVKYAALSAIKVSDYFT